MPAQECEDCESFSTADWVTHYCNGGLPLTRWLCMMWGPSWAKALASSQISPFQEELSCVLNLHHHNLWLYNRDSTNRTPCLQSLDPVDILILLTRFSLHLIVVSGAIKTILLTIHSFEYVKQWAVAGHTITFRRSSNMTMNETVHGWQHSVNETVLTASRFTITDKFPCIKIDVCISVSWWQ